MLGALSMANIAILQYLFVNPLEVVMFTLWYLFSVIMSKEERLHRAVAQRNIHNVRELLKQNPTLDKPECVEVMSLAADDDDTEIAWTLAKAGANVKALRKDVVHKLVSSEDPKKNELALLLLDRGVDVNALDERNARAIFHAVRRESMGLASELLRRGILVDENAIREAAERSKAPELLRLLISRKASDEETRNRRGLLALACLVQSKKREDEILPAVRVVLDLKMDLNRFDVNCKNGTILCDAIAFKREKVVELLIKHGADIDQKTPVGTYPLYEAVTLCQDSIVCSLLRKGASIERRRGIENFLNSATSRGSYPIHSACTVYCVPSLKLLLAYGADINVRDERDKTSFSLLKSRISTAHHAMIKHIALLVARSAEVPESDLEIIDRDAEMCQFYDKCLSEVDEAKGISVTGDLSLYDVMIKNVKELSFLARSEHFATRYKEFISKASFPTYFSSMKFTLKEAVERRNSLVHHERAIYETFCNVLPTLPIEKIMFYYYL